MTQVRLRVESEGMPMLLDYAEPTISPEDRALFDTLVPFDHWTRRADKHFDFLLLRKAIENKFKDIGRPAIEPVLFLKLELLLFHDNLSDNQVFSRTNTDLAYRRFLGLGRDDYLPTIDAFRKFRARLGPDGHKEIFHALLEQARQYGLVKDRLRLKDATHVYANIAVPAGIQLIAQARNKLLNAAEPFSKDNVEAERVRILTIRDSTDSCNNEARLIARVEHLRDIVAWVEDIAEPDDADNSDAWQKLIAAAKIAHKVLTGQDDPKAKHKIRSTHDPDARRGRHGEFYDGYMLDALVDADSELFTSINVLPADGNESADALTLIEQEQTAHGNDIEQVSIDGAGYDGPTIRALESEDGPHVDVFVPDRADSNGGRFTADDFELSEDGLHVTCPAGETSRYKQRDEGRHTTHHRFAKSACESCPFREQCLSKHDQKHGRSVRKNDYQAEYDMVRTRSQTEEYASVKKEHPKVERRLGDIVNRYGGRRARYRGLDRVTIQEFLCGTVSNMKRMLRLLDGKSAFAFS